MSKTFISSNPPPTVTQALWSANLHALDLTKHKKYIIHQVLQFGDLQAIAWLFSVYRKETVKEVFICQAENVYTPRSFNFISKYVLGIVPDSLNQQLYVSNI